MGVGGEGLGLKGSWLSVRAVYFACSRVARAFLESALLQDFARGPCKCFTNNVEQVVLFLGSRYVCCSLGCYVKGNPSARAWGYGSQQASFLRGSRVDERASNLRVLSRE